MHQKVLYFLCSVAFSMRGSLYLFPYGQGNNPGSYQTGNAYVKDIA